jgi:hypothetical protein
MRLLKRMEEVSLSSIGEAIAGPPNARTTLRQHVKAASNFTFLHVYQSLFEETCNVVDEWMHISLVLACS